MANDHFVSRFYLQRFSDDDRSIRAINLKRKKITFDASIAGQCKEAGFHDFAPGLEDALSGLEGRIASVFRSMVDHQSPPSLGSLEDKSLKFFVVLQRSKTEAEAEEGEFLFDKTMKIAVENDPRFAGVDLSKIKTRSKYPAAIPIQIAMQIAPVALNLASHLFRNMTDVEFVTSDNPVVLHNQFCEGMTYQGVCGWDCAGLQVILPIGPQWLLLLYDGAVYKIGNRREQFSTIESRDEVRLLNSFQILNARNNVYFHRKTDADAVLAQVVQLASQHQKIKGKIVRTYEVPSSDGGSSELLHYFTPLLPLRLVLSGIRIRRRKRTISLDDRARMQRLTQKRPDVARSGPTTTYRARQS